MSDEECAQLLKILGNPEGVDCYTDGKKFMLMLKVDGLRLDNVFKIFDGIRSKAPKQHAGKPVCVAPVGVFEV
jgi:hypothetical protein